MLIAIPESATTHEAKKCVLLENFGIKFVNPVNIVSITYDNIDTILKFDSGDRMIDFVYGGGDCANRLKTLIHRQEKSTSK